jgi:prevent-host-death family protein
LARREDISTPLSIVRRIKGSIRMSEIVNLSKAQANLSQLIDRSVAGEDIIIAKNGVPMARLAPIAFIGERRKPAGALAVESIAENFDALLPTDLQAAFEGKS